MAASAAETAAFEGKGPISRRTCGERGGDALRSGPSGENRTMSHIIRTLDRLLDLAVLLICALVLAVSGYSLLDNALLYRQADDPSVLQYKPRLDRPLSAPADGGEAGEGGGEDTRRISENQVAWICFEDSGVDFPVLQGEDNFVYLNRDPYGEFSLSGSIFLDCRNAPDFSDPYSVIYGHHMEHGKMFGCLDRYLDRAFFEAHRTGTLVTGDAVWRCELFAVLHADGSDRILFRPEGRSAGQVRAYAEECAEIYVPPTAEGRVLALSTCHGDTFSSRLLVLGILIVE